jgi:hypothetical protein
VAGRVRSIGKSSDFIGNGGLAYLMIAFCLSKDMLIAETYIYGCTELG